MADQGVELKFFYHNLLSATGSSVSASSTATGDYAIDNIHNMLETNLWQSATTPTTHEINLDLGTGKLTNGDFDAGSTAGWTFLTPGTATATFSASTVAPAQGTHSGLISISNSGSISTSIGLIQLRYLNNTIKNNCKQYICFYGRATAARTMQFEIRKITPFTAYADEGAQTINLTTSWQWFTNELTANANTNDAALVFYLSGASNVGVELDNVCWWEEPIIPQADYLALLGHNLADATTSIALRYADDATSYSTATSGNVLTNNVYLNEFTKTDSHRYWRLNLSGMTTAVSIKVASFGVKSTVAFIQPPFDPYGQQIQADVNITQGGYMSGTHKKYTEREMTLNFPNASSSVYKILHDWYTNNGMKNFFMAWDTLNDSSAVYLVRPDGNFTNPLNVDKYRNITINLRGRKEE